MSAGELFSPCPFYQMAAKVMCDSGVAQIEKRALLRELKLVFYRTGNEDLLSR